MKLITEDTVRHLLRTKELYDGAQFELQQPSLLTPSAQSFLREHHITVLPNLKNTLAEPVESLSDQKSSAVVSKHLPNKEVLLECQHLANLLYFPDFEEETFAAEWWLYFEQQQRWLKKFSSQCTEQRFSKEKIKTPTIPVVIPLTKRRRWLFVCGELEYQIAKILYRMTTEEAGECSQVFLRWSEELLKVIRSAKNE